MFIRIYRSVSSIRIATLLFFIMSLVAVANTGCHSSTSKTTTVNQTISLKGEGFISVGGNAPLKVTQKTSGKADADVTKNVTWRVSPEGAVTIDKDGVATGVAKANVSITASLGNMDATLNVLVDEVGNIKSVAIEGPDSVTVGGSIQLTAKVTTKDDKTADATNSVKWSSSNGEFVSTSNDEGTYGIVTGKSVGKAKISATIASVTAGYDVTVNPAPVDPTAYIVNSTGSSGNSISACRATASGARDCSVVLKNPLKNPSQIAVSLDNSSLYITNAGDNTILLCNKDDISKCDVVATGVANPYGIAINGSDMYVGSNGGIYVYKIGDGGKLDEGSVVTHNAAFDNTSPAKVSGIHIKKFNDINYMYFGNAATAEINIFKCKITARTLLEGCVASDVTDTAVGTSAIKFNRDRTKAYAVNQSAVADKQIYALSVDASGVLTTPTAITVGAAFVNPTSIEIRRANDQAEYFYIGHNNGVSKCTLSVATFTCVQQMGNLILAVDDIIFDGSDVYITSMSSSGKIWKATVNDTGDLSNPVIQNVALNVPSNITIGKSASGSIYAHIIDSERIFNCKLNNQLLESCNYNTLVSLGLTSAPKSIVFNGDYAYFATGTAASTEQVRFCKYQDGKFTACNNSGLNSANNNSSSSIAFKVIGDQMKVYVTNRANLTDVVTVCIVSADGTFVGCANDPGTYNGVKQISIKDGYPYLLYSNKVSSCSLDVNGNIATCKDTINPFNTAEAIAFTSNYAYITNSAANNVTYCGINSGKLVNCLQTAQLLSGAKGIAIL